ncbi:hypothetical protein H5410_047518 [Solanum commersonii]|uniref:RNase H family protein n=1 Tax=Solanum commersonii TaxID=4109 RepID=A0A9J5XII0_SOLCO|nr:hypothetical protein H5410_047518 [Solanum commersonii]
MYLGGRAILIRHILLAMPVHLLASTSTKTGSCINGENLNNFFWGSIEGKDKHHWASWDQDMLFQKSKYFRWPHPLTKQLTSHVSQSWRAICKISHLPYGIRPGHIKLNEVWQAEVWHELLIGVHCPGSLWNRLHSMNLTKHIFGKQNLDTRWENLKSLIGSPMETRMYRLVKWAKPQVNSDGSCIDGNCGAGGVIRDYNGRFIMELVQVIGLKGELCWLVYNIVLCKAYTKSLRGYLRTIDLVDKTKEIMVERGVIVQYCYREAIKVADKLAFLNWMHKKFDFHHIFRNVKVSKGSIELDRLEMASFWVQQKKATKIQFDPPLVA